MVSRYHHGFYEELQPVSPGPEAVPVVAQWAGYPRTAAYEGPLAGTGRHAELEAAPLDGHVSAYHPGRSDVAAPSPAETITTKITSIFTKKHEHPPHHEFPPITEPFRGPVDETGRRGELHTAPLEHHVSAYHPGHYDHMEPVPIVVHREEEKEEKKEKTPGALEKLTHMFKRSRTMEEFPAPTEPYTGPVASARPMAELSADQPLNTMVTVYSSGRSDEQPPSTIITTPTTKQIGHPDYPAPEAVFRGHVQETRRSELEGTPLDSHVTAYHPGRSDLEPPAAEPEAEKHETIVTRITSLFKKSHDDYPPISEPYQGMVAETRPHYELHAVPITERVEQLHRGYYDQLTQAVPLQAVREETPSEAERKPGALEKLTHMFRRSTHDGEYPPPTGWFMAFV